MGLGSTEPRRVAVARSGPGLFPAHSPIIAQLHRDQSIIQSIATLVWTKGFSNWTQAASICGQIIVEPSRYRCNVGGERRGTEVHAGLAPGDRRTQWHSAHRLEDPWAFVNRKRRVLESCIFPKETSCMAVRLEKPRQTRDGALW